jgi:hypothetical protein
VASSSQPIIDLVDDTDDNDTTKTSPQNIETDDIISSFKDVDNQKRTINADNDFHYNQYLEIVNEDCEKYNEQQERCVKNGIELGDNMCELAVSCHVQTKTIPKGIPKSIKGVAFEILPNLRKGGNVGNNSKVPYEIIHDEDRYQKVDITKLSSIVKKKLQKQKQLRFSRDELYNKLVESIADLRLFLEQHKHSSYVFPKNIEENNPDIDFLFYQKCHVTLSSVMESESPQQKKQRYLL